ncbi:LEC14B protein [Galdieria sulphuraria]|nr:LEC14B protein [Galdieria sulphuraria]
MAHNTSSSSSHSWTFGFLMAAAVVTAQQNQENLLAKEHELLHRIKRQTDGTSFKTVTSLLERRERTGNLKSSAKANITQRFVPNLFRAYVSKCSRRIYGGFFSPDGTLFCSSEQDDAINIFQTDCCVNSWKHIKAIPCRNVNWTVTDMSMSPNQSLLAFTSITSLVQLVGVASDSSFYQCVSLGTRSSEGFGLWSIRFSPSGSQLLAGSANNAVLLYDLISFLDDTGNVFVSGSDDSFCMLWDRRTQQKKNGPIGIFAGHSDGITYICPKGDGLYFISNSKDQTIKLWDTRKMVSTNDWKQLLSTRPPRHVWDYRWMEYPRPVNVGRVHEKDTSLRTFVGHQTLKTLIRCRFSPQSTTGQRYVYCGSHDGAVYIYDIVQGELMTQLKGHKAVVRDVDWHPYLPVMASSSWDGTIALWSSHPWQTTVWRDAEDTPLWDSLSEEEDDDDEESEYSEESDEESECSDEESDEDDCSDREDTDEDSSS